MSFSPQQAELEALTRDFRDALDGRPVANIREAARVTGLHANTLRRAIWVGQLRGSRRAKNGPILITCREIARWILDGQRLSLPWYSG